MKSASRKPQPKRKYFKSRGFSRLFCFSWEQRKLGDVVQITMGQSPDGSTYSDEPSDYILVQGNADLQNGWVCPRIWTTQITKKADAGDLIMSVRAPAGAMGKTAYNAVIGRGVAAIKGNEFIYQLLVKMDTDGFWKTLSCGSTFESLNSDNIKNAEVKIPATAEQIKIGGLFQYLDNLITLHQREYAKLVNIKASMLEKMFPKDGSAYPEVRFAGFTDAWEQRKFSELVQIERGGSPRPIDDFITDAPNGLNWVKIGDAPTQGNYITKTAEKIRPEGLSKTREVHPGDLILSNSMSFGKPYIMGIDGCIHDGWLLIRNTYGVFDLTFLCHLLGTPQMLSQYRSLAAGSTVNNLNKELVGNTYVTIPSITEQRVLGAYLEQLDHLITLHQREQITENIMKNSLKKRFFEAERTYYDFQ